MRVLHNHTDLLKKDRKFVFDDKCETSFETLKRELMKAPVLAIYDPRRKTQLHTDASSIGFGAVLMQLQDDGKYHPVSYYSRKASDAESRYHSFELEILGMVYGVRKFEPMLKAIKFEFVTDCMAAAQTLEKKQINLKVGKCQWSCRAMFTMLSIEKERVWAMLML